MSLSEKIKNQEKSKNDISWTPEKEKELQATNFLITKIENDLKNIELQLKKEENKKAVKLGKTISTIGTALGIGIATYLIHEKEAKQKEENKETTKTEEVVEEKKKLKENTSTAFEEKKEEEKLNFNQELYNSLPEIGDIIYKFYAENNPTPGSGYQILDKEEAISYIFNDKNELVAKIPSGFGQDEGDEKNTSVEFEKGKKTTPAGVYIMSKNIHPNDKKRYGNLNFALYGISISGDKVKLGNHQTYMENGQFEPRTNKLNSESPEDNKFSDGCVNNRPEDFKKYLASTFKGDDSELFFVLPDQKSRESGVKFDINSLVKNIMPTILKSFEIKIEKKQKEITENLKIIETYVADSVKLEQERIKLVDEYQKDKKNVSKQKKIEKIKEAQKQKKDLLSEARKKLTILTKEQEEITTKRGKIAQFLSKNQ